MSFFRYFVRYLDRRSIIALSKFSYPPTLYPPVPLGADLIVYVAQYREIGLKPVA
jgi:hypothetical protein